MRCREVEALWDDIREGMPPMRDAVRSHLQSCSRCQDLYEQYEGVAYCLSCLPPPEPSCDLTKKIVEHLAALSIRRGATPITLTKVPTPIGLIYVGLREARITYVSLDTGEPLNQIKDRAARRLRRPVTMGEPPPWLPAILEDFFRTWRVDQERVDLSDLTAFEQAALRAAAQIPPGEVRSYSWVAQTIGRPKAARAVGQVMAHNPLPLLFPCHRVVDATGALHNYGYGIEMKARLLKMEGYCGAER